MLAERNTRGLDSVVANADAMHLRADKLIGRPEASEEEAELALITNTVERYEATRWPEDKVPAGKG